ncbi:hypothetical protein N7513_011391 [Penicillium frequentans]|nr:hypothetical protein N7513_011391 [Penicillium glabrum]
MPPKRRRSDPSSADPSLTDASPSISNPPEEPKARPRRGAFTDLLALRCYTPGSTSRSSAAMYLKATKNAQKAFKYECMCLDWVQDLKHGLESKEKTDGEVIVNPDLLIHVPMLRGPAGIPQLRWWRDLFVHKTGLETQKHP